MNAGVAVPAGITEGSRAWVTSLARALALSAISQPSGVLLRLIVGGPIALLWVAFDARGLPADSDVRRQRLVCLPNLVAARVARAVLVLGGWVQAGRRDCSAPGAPLRVPAGDCSEDSG